VVRARARTALAGPAFAAPVDTTGDGRANLIRVVHPARTGARASTFALADRGQGGLAVSRASEAAAPAYGRLTTAPAPTSGIVTTASGLQYRDVVVGTGASPSGADATVQVTYRGWLLDGTPIDAGQGQSFPLNGVIAGWAEGIAAMRVGGRRQLIIPADLAYGAKGTGSVPPGSTLVFDVELLSTT
jgi:FKBP-type peptidyl-prolyl cis-trans isomerase